MMPNKIQFEIFAEANPKNNPTIPIIPKERHDMEKEKEFTKKLQYYLQEIQKSSKPKQVTSCFSIGTEKS
jgi:hypothetical protein